MEMSDDVDSIKPTDLAAGGSCRAKLISQKQNAREVTRVRFLENFLQTQGLLVARGLGLAEAFAVAPALAAGLAAVVARAGLFRDVTTSVVKSTFSREYITIGTPFKLMPDLSKTKS